MMQYSTKFRECLTHVGSIVCKLEEENQSAHFATSVPYWLTCKQCISPVSHISRENVVRCSELLLSLMELFHIRQRFTASLSYCHCVRCFQVRVSFGLPVAYWWRGFVHLKVHPRLLQKIWISRSYNCLSTVMWIQSMKNEAFEGREELQAVPNIY